MPLITDYANDPSTTDGDRFLTADSNNATRLTPTSNLKAYMAAGWVPANDTWSFGSFNAVANTGVINTNSGAANKYSVGQKIMLSQPTLGIKYGRVISVASSAITVFMASGTLANEGISAPMYTGMYAPYGFPSNAAGANFEQDTKSVPFGMLTYDSYGTTGGQVVQPGSDAVLAFPFFENNLHYGITMPTAGHLQFAYAGVYTVTLQVNMTDRSSDQAIYSCWIQSSTDGTNYPVNSPISPEATFVINRGVSRTVTQYFAAGTLVRAKVATGVGGIRFAAGDVTSKYSFSLSAVKVG